MPRRSKLHSARARETAQKLASPDMVATRFVLSDDSTTQVPWSATFSNYVDKFIVANRLLLNVVISNAYWSTPSSPTKTDEAEESKDNTSDSKMVGVRKHCLAIEFSCDMTTDEFKVANDPRIVLEAMHPVSNNMRNTLAPLLGCSPDVVDKLDHTRQTFAHSFVVVFFLTVRKMIPSIILQQQEESPPATVFVSVITQDVIECHPIVAHRVNSILPSHAKDFVITPLSDAQAENETEALAQAARSQRINTLIQSMAEFRLQEG
jgi:hypothetical protein